MPGLLPGRLPPAPCLSRLRTDTCGAVRYVITDGPCLFSQQGLQKTYIQTLGLTEHRRSAALPSAVEQIACRGQACRSQDRVRPGGQTQVTACRRAKTGYIPKQFPQVPLQGAAPADVRDCPGTTEVELLQIGTQGLPLLQSRPADPVRQFFVEAAEAGIFIETVPGDLFLRPDSVPVRQRTACRRIHPQAIQKTGKCYRDRKPGPADRFLIGHGPAVQRNPQAPAGDLQIKGRRILRARQQPVSLQQQPAVPPQEKNFLCPVRPYPVQEPQGKAADRGPQDLPAEPGRIRLFPHGIHDRFLDRFHNRIYNRIHDRIQNMTHKQSSAALFAHAMPPSGPSALLRRLSLYSPTENPAGS